MVLPVLIDSLFLCLLLVLFALQRPETLFAATALCGIYAITRTRFLSVDRNALAWVLLGMLMLMIVLILRNDAQISAIFYILSTGFVFHAANRFSSLPLAHVRRCLEGAFWFSVVGILTGLALHWGQPEPLGKIIPGSSTNGLPSYLIVLQVAVSIAVFLERGRLPLLSALATFLIAMFGVGRGSIIVSVLIVLVSYLGNVWLATRENGRRALKPHLWVVVGFACLGTIYFLMGSRELAVIFSQTKWAWGVMDPPRARMVTDYLAKLDALSLWVGTGYAGTAIDEFYGGNPHNSYLRLHSLFGLPGFFLVLLSPLLIFVSSKRIQARCIVGGLVLLVMIRAISEPILFPTALDFFFFLYFFLFWRYAPIRDSR